SVICTVPAASATYTLSLHDALPISAHAFVTKLNPTGSGIVYSAYLGGSAEENGLGIAVDAAGNAYVTGLTGSRNFPTTPGAFQTDRKSTRLNSSHVSISYAVFCLKK